jgi:hypothetical protein
MKKEIYLCPISKELGMRSIIDKKKILHIPRGIAAARRWHGTIDEHFSNIDNLVSMIQGLSAWGILSVFSQIVTNRTQLVTLIPITTDIPSIIARSTATRQSKCIQRAGLPSPSRFARTRSATNNPFGFPADHIEIIN